MSRALEKHGGMGNQDTLRKEEVFGMTAMKDLCWEKL